MSEILERPRVQPRPTTDDHQPLEFTVLDAHGNALARLASAEALSLSIATPAFGSPRIRLRAGYTITVTPRKRRPYHGDPRRGLKQAAEDLHALVRSRKVRT